jgi:menaquinone-9 beta-reductase
MKEYDVVIIGGGPAGASAALFLEKKGYSIALLDQALFPRDKVCGEFISPAADDIFSELGILEAIDSLNPIRLSGVILSAYESSYLQVDYPVSMHGRTMTSLSLERSKLDSLMIDHVRNSRIRLLEGFKVTDFLFDGENVCGVKGYDELKTKFRIKSKVVIDAGGRNSISLRRLNLRNSFSAKGRIALAAHWEGVKELGSYCHMHISYPGYTGIAPVGINRANVVLVVDKGSFDGANVESFFMETVLGNRLRRRILGAGSPIEKIRAVDSLSYSVKKPKCGGLLLVGDATGFMDPFTGEGIYLSLRSSQIAARIVNAAFDRADFSSRQLERYDLMRRKEFREKNILSKALQYLIYKPSFCKHVIEALSNKKELSSLLVGVIGDYIPANKVVCFDYLLRLIYEMLKRSQSRLIRGSQGFSSYRASK